MNFSKDEIKTINAIKARHMAEFEATTLNLRSSQFTFGSLRVTTFRDGSVTVERV